MSGVLQEAVEQDEVGTPVLVREVSPALGKNTTVQCQSPLTEPSPFLRPRGHSSVLQAGAAGPWLWPPPAADGAVCLIESGEGLLGATHAPSRPSLCAYRPH